MGYEFSNSSYYTDLAFLEGYLLAKYSCSDRKEVRIHSKQYNLSICTISAYYLDFEMLVVISAALKLLSPHVLSNGHAVDYSPQLAV